MKICLDYGDEYGINTSREIKQAALNSQRRCMRERGNNCTLGEQKDHYKNTFEFTL